MHFMYFKDEVRDFEQIPKGEGEKAEARDRSRWRSDGQDVRRRNSNGKSITTNTASGILR